MHDASHLIRAMYVMYSMRVCNRYTCSCDISCIVRNTCDVCMSCMQHVIYTCMRATSNVLRVMYVVYQWYVCNVCNVCSSVCDNLCHVCNANVVCMTCV